MMSKLDPNVLGWVVIAAFQALTAYFAWRAQSVSIETRAIAQKTELNTNSMKDALVKATGEAAYAAGADEQRVIGEAKAATLAEGAKRERDQP